MPQVPEYENQAAPPRSLGTKPQRPQTEGLEETAQAAEEFQKFSRQQFEDDLKSAIVDAENEFQERSRQKMQEMKQLHGKDAVGNEAEDRQGLTEKADSALDGIKQDYEDRLPQQFQPILDNRLEKVKQSWMDNAARWEAKEEERLQEHRAAKAVESTTDTIQAADADPETVKESLKSLKQRLTAIHGKNYVSQAKFQEGKRQGIKSAILASISNNNAEQAQEYLQDYRELFSEEDVQTFQKMVDDTRTKQQVDQWTERLSGLPYQRQLDRIEEIEDQEVKQLVFNQVQGEERINDTIKKERQSQQYQKRWEQIMMAKHDPKQNNMPEVQEIMDDPLLSVPQRERLINMIGDQPETEDQRRLQNKVWYDFHSRINSGRNPPSRREIMTASANGQISPGMERSLLRELDDGTDFPSLGKAKDHLRYQLREKSNIIDSDEQWKNFQRDLEVWAYQYQQETGKNPSYEQIMQFADELSQKPKDESWLPWYTGNPPAPYKRDELPHYRQMIRPEGVPEDAQWDAEAGAYIVERDGDTFAAVPQGNEVRWLRRSGGQQTQEQQ